MVEMRPEGFMIRERGAGRLKEGRKDRHESLGLGWLLLG